jgi:hypothetical protein
MRRKVEDAGGDKVLALPSCMHMMHIRVVLLFYIGLIFGDSKCAGG